MRVVGREELLLLEVLAKMGIVSLLENEEWSEDILIYHWENCAR